MGPSNANDTPTIELLQRVHQGDGQAREALFARYQERVLAIVRVRLSARLRARMESQDVMQDVLLEALGNLERFEMRDESSLIRWLAVLVEHRIGQHARRQGAAKRAALERPLDSADGELDQPGVASVSAQLAALEERERVQAVLARLPELQRELVLLRDYAGAPWSEIASELGLDSADAARMLHARTLVRMSSLLRVAP